jgi:hypothetical protein
MDRDQNRDDLQGERDDESERESEREQHRDRKEEEHRPNPPHTTTGKITVPKFGSATSGGGEIEPGIEKN